MPTRRSGPRKPSRRLERPAVTEKAPSAVSPEAPEPAAAEPAPRKAPPARNPLFPVGASLYPLASEVDSPEDWYARDMTAELDLLASARCALVRLFVSWRVLEPQVGQYSTEALDRLAELVTAVAERRMQAIVCFFADDRHADLSEVGWAKRRDPRTDSYLVQREVALVAKVVSHLHGAKGVFGWQLGNEAFLSGFESADDFAAWTSALTEALREHDPERPIAVGAQAETLYRASGVDARAAIEDAEFALAHATAAYRAYAAEGPLTTGVSTYLESFLLRLARRSAPVLLDELGVFSLDHSLAEEAAAVRLGLWGALCNRAAGVLVRRVGDLETERREPYFLDPFESLVGVVDAAGEPKPAFDEVREFVRTTARIDLSTHVLTTERTAVVVPSERFEPLPSLAGLFDPRACLSAFVTAKRAQLPVTVIREQDDYADYRVLVVPSAFRLAEDTWQRLGAFVQSGGTLLASYGGGDAPAALGEIFGVDFLGDDGPREMLSCRVAQPDMLGDLESFDVVFELPNHALLSGSTATVVATDAEGNPLLTVNQAGQGRAVYVAAPVERAVAQQDPWATPRPVSTLLREVYGAVARGAGSGAPLACDTPEVEVALFQGDADDVLVLINHGTDKVSANLTLERRVATIADVRGGREVTVGGTTFGVPLGGNGVAALRLTYG